MLFNELSIYLEKLEHTTSRNTMVEILSELFLKTPPQSIDKVVYLLQGRVAPSYVSVEMGMADKMIIRAIALAYDVGQKEVEKMYNKAGDLGKTVLELAKKGGKHSSNISVSDVFDILQEVASKSGEGTVDTKIKLVSDLLKKLDPLSACYVARIPVGKLRLGFSDMTVLDSLSWMIDKNKENRALIEKAFNVRPDLGFIAKSVKESGVESLEKVQPQIGTPILMARAERLSSSQEILDKIGTCAVEAKYDGLRLQVHLKKLKNEKFIKIFTRNLEEVTHMFPDIVEGIKKQILAEKVILEGEAIAYNRETNEFLPFQETTQRRRKYDIEQKAKDIPLKLVCFELLYCNGKNFIPEPFKVRRKELESKVKKGLPAGRQGEILEVSEMKILDNAKDIEIMFDEKVSQGLEGILAKRLDGAYQAGARGWNWIKFKRSYSSVLDDTIDALVMGYNFGQGKRTGFGLGAFLIGVYDNKQDKFVTIAKIGTGLSDEEWKLLFKRCQKLKAKDKPPLYEVSKLLEPDVWVEPEIVVEIRADEITRSPAHTAGRIMKPSKSGSAFEVDVPGYALRFPRLEKFRDDKKPEDATTLKEVEKMFKAQINQRTKRAG